MALLLDAAFYGHKPAQNSFYSGGSVSSLVPDTFIVSLGGHNFIVDFDQPFYRQYRRQIAPLLRTQADTSKQPSEQSLDPNGLWRRSFEDWSLGAGQRYRDRTESVDNRFWASKGIDCLTNKWQISLLPDTTSVLTTTNANLAMVVAGSYLYAIDGQALKFYDGSTWTTVTGTPAATASSICTDGYDVWVAYGADGIYTTTAGASSASQYVTSAISTSAVVGYANGRLMLGSGASLYNITASGALPTALFTAGSPNFTWLAFAEGPTHLYAAGNAGTRSYIYGTAIMTDGTALDAPVIQGRLPEGETVSSITGYLGSLIIGTSEGVRFATVDSTGSITIEALIPTTTSVLCSAGWNRFVYFGWTNYDSTSTGLGRMDLENFVVADVQPAYASDLMATAQGEITSVAVYGGNVYFALAAQGIYVQDNTKLVASGTIDSGYILYDLADTKVAVLLDVETLGALQYGSYSGYVSADTGSFAVVGSHSPGQTEPVTFSTGGISAQRFEVRLVLNADATNINDGPTVTRTTLRSYPAPRRPITWQLPLILDEQVVDNSGNSTGFDPQTELKALEYMASSGQLVVFQEGKNSYPVFVQDVNFLPDYSTENRSYFNGIALVQLAGLPVNK